MFTLYKKTFLLSLTCSELVGMEVLRGSRGRHKAQACGPRSGNDRHDDMMIIMIVLIMMAVQLIRNLRIMMAILTKGHLVF